MRRIAEGFIRGACLNPKLGQRVQDTTEQLENGLRLKAFLLSRPIESGKKMMLLLFAGYCEHARIGQCDRAITRVGMH